MQFADQQPGTPLPPLVIIPACNEAESLPADLRALRDRSMQSGSTIDVVDGSTDATARIARAASVRRAPTP